MTATDRKPPGVALRNRAEPRRIAAETDRLATLKTHKKGLMQQLFPSGEIRVS